MATKAEEIRKQSEMYEKVQNLMRNVNEETLKEAHRKQPGKKAAGTDGETKAGYEENLEENIQKLVRRMKTFSYRPQAVRRVYIPKANGKMRPLGIPAYEDKLVQSVMADILNAVYEPRFLDCSYGFRPKRKAHDVIRFINQTVMIKKVNYVLEADIKGFFDNVDHGWMMKFLENDIADKNFLRYITRFLKAGIMEGTEILDADKGTPQGGLISPVLANVYLHYVLDLWFEKYVKGNLTGGAYYVRYADDFLILFENEADAGAVMDVLPGRLAKFGLELAEDKTRILPFGRYKGTKESFDFLGFTFFNTTTRTGKYRVGIRSSAKKMKAKRQAVKEWLRGRLTKPIAETMTKLHKKVEGHYNYYGISGNLREINKFTWYVWHTAYRMFNRRDQKGKMKIDSFKRIWNYYMGKPSIRVDIWGWNQMVA
ncbi:MAG: group II intron reverse transcriptase/maturase [Erysipelotrichaceae bacterium]|nr:group II intron reverse transcriptase/maturase [Erysipelotrichaceae bacterium]